MCCVIPTIKLCSIWCKNGSMFLRQKCDQMTSTGISSYKLYILKPSAPGRWIDCGLYHAETHSWFVVLRVYLHVWLMFHEGHFELKKNYDGADFHVLPHWSIYHISKIAFPQNFFRFKINSVICVTLPKYNVWKKDSMTNPRRT